MQERIGLPLPDIEILTLCRFGIGEQVAYMQKLFWLRGIITVVQVSWGHRLPLVVGPASTLLVGLVESTSARVPMARVPQFVGLSSALSMLALFLVIR